MPYLSHESLWQSSIVANNRMNRQRQLTGVNSYQKDLGLDILAFLMQCHARHGETVRWLDICCGEGRALLSLAHHCHTTQLADQVELIGLDLVDMFTPFDQDRLPFLRFVGQPIETWNFPTPFDLITCVHGLHYVGDKLGVLQKIGQMLTPHGQFWGHLDLDHLKDEEGKSLGNRLIKSWKSMGWHYDRRSRCLVIHGRSKWPMNWAYLGADDQVGPSYTGQEAVASCYRVDI